MSGTQPAPAQSPTNPWIGIAAVLCGAFISTVTGRLSAFGLNDIRGAMGAGFDEGAWITTAQGAAQMLIGPVAVWLGVIFGPRRVLFLSVLCYAAATALLPFSPSLPVLLGAQFACGLATGTFIPLTIAFVLRNLPPRFWAFGIAAYALNLELSLNISATLEGFYVERLSWPFIFWQGVPMALLMAWCIHRGIPRDPVNWQAARGGDWFGMASLSAGLALVYAALDQGNRLDWLGSGLVVGLLMGGGLLLAAFLVNEVLTPTPWLDLRFAARMPMPALMVLISLVRLAILSTALLLPNFLSVVQGYRALETGPALLVIGLPQLVIAPAAGLLLRRLDARLVMTAGFGLIGGACWLVASELTRDWVTADFLPASAMQGLGQTMAMSALIFFGVLHLRPADAMTFGAMLQTARLFGGEMGTALVGTFVRVREQVASLFIGSRVATGDPDVVARLQAYAGALGPRSGGDAAAARATALLGQAIRQQATVQSYIDGFALVAIIIVGALVVVALLGRAPDGPASPALRPAQRPERA